MARQYPDCPWLNEAKTGHAKLHRCSQCIPDTFSYIIQISGRNRQDKCKLEFCVEIRKIIQLLL